MEAGTKFVSVTPGTDAGVKFVERLLAAILALAIFNRSIKWFFEPETGNPLLLSSVRKSITRISSSFIGFSVGVFSAWLLFF